jgi:ABC-2 type transport system ATP-binding protein
MLKKVQPDIPQWDTAIKLTGVTKTFEQWQRSNKGKNILKNLIKPEKRTIAALDNISFEIKKGEFVAYAGANGAGKSTTMKLLCGMLLPVSGDIEVLSLSPQKDRIQLMNRIGVLFGNRTELWWDHPVIQSFEWKRVVWDIPRQRYDKMYEIVVELLDLKDILHTFARELSLGQRMKADLAMLLLHEPELILLDEPTIGLDVLAKRQMINFLKKLNKEKNTTIIITSHDMDDLEEMAHRILLVNEGKLAFDGSFEDLRKSTGGMSRLVLNITYNAPPKLNTAKLISAEENVCEYEFDITQTPIKSILAEVSTLDNVADVEIKKAPIEEIITGLYRQWKS